MRNASTLSQGTAAGSGSPDGSVRLPEQLRGDLAIFVATADIAIDTELVFLSTVAFGGAIGAIIVVLAAVLLFFVLVIPAEKAGGDYAYTAALSKMTDALKAG